jgi:hypothetical protein
MEGTAMDCNNCPNVERTDHVCDDCNPFDGFEIISCYTWDDACNDGTFVNVSRLASKVGYTIPVALTRSVFGKLEVKNDENATDQRINALLMLLAIHIKELKEKGKTDNNMITYNAELGEEREGITTVWATIEGRNPKNPEPVMTIMLPEDY